MANDLRAGDANEPGQKRPSAARPLQDAESGAYTMLARMMEKLELIAVEQQRARARADDLARRLGESEKLLEARASRDSGQEAASIGARMAASTQALNQVNAGFAKLEARMARLEKRVESAGGGAGDGPSVAEAMRAALAGWHAEHPDRPAQTERLLTELTEARERFRSIEAALERVQNLKALERPAGASTAEAKALADAVRGLHGAVVENASGIARDCEAIKSLLTAAAKTQRSDLSVSETRVLRAVERSDKTRGEELRAIAAEIGAMVEAKLDAAVEKAVKAVSGDLATVKRGFAELAARPVPAAEPSGATKALEAGLATIGRDLVGVKRAVQDLAARPAPSAEPSEATQALEAGLTAIGRDLAGMKRAIQELAARPEPDLEPGISSEMFETNLSVIGQSLTGLKRAVAELAAQSGPDAGQDAPSEVLEMRLASVSSDVADLKRAVADMARNIADAAASGAAEHATTREARTMLAVALAEMRSELSGLRESVAGALETSVPASQPETPPIALDTAGLDAALDRLEGLLGREENAVDAISDLGESLARIIHDIAEEGVMRLQDAARRLEGASPEPARREAAAAEAGAGAEAEIDARQEPAPRLDAWPDDALAPFGCGALSEDEASDPTRSTPERVAAAVAQTDAAYRARREAEQLAEQLAWWDDEALDATLHGPRQAG